MADDRLNLLFVFGDQWRAQATGYAGDPNVVTPHLDRLAQSSLNFTTAVANCPVCTPARASLITGQYPLTTGLFVNDVPLDPAAPSIGKVLRDGGYHTGWIGKWHVDGHGRSSYVPPERRQGFEHWQVLECTHRYFDSKYYEGDDPTLRTWSGYDAVAQTTAACDFIKSKRDKERPFALFLSWGPPHDPYMEAPPEYLARYEPDTLALRPNVPAKDAEEYARKQLHGYYAHCTALDDQVGRLVRMLDETGLADNTLLVFTSDHGDMLGSHASTNKQRPWDESILVPLLMRCPRLFGRGSRVIETPIGITDYMPTLLDLLGLEAPLGVESRNFGPFLRGEVAKPPTDAQLIASYQPFANWGHNWGGREYRGLRTSRYTYVRDLDGPWLLYDNNRDPYQLQNLVDEPDAATTIATLDDQLSRELARLGDDFRPGADYLAQWGYTVDANGAVPYTQ